MIRSKIVKSGLVIMLILLTNTFCFSTTAEASTGNGGVCLSFDDAYIDQWYTTLYPLLDLYNAVGTLYISGNPFGNMGFTETQWTRLQTMNQSGIEIGSHGYNHTSYTEYAAAGGTSEGYFTIEVDKCDNILESRGYNDIVSFAYPYGDRTNESDAAINAHGYKILRGAIKKTGYASVTDMPIYYAPGPSYGVVNAAFIDSEWDFSLTETEVLEALQYARDNNLIVCMLQHQTTNTDLIDTILEYADYYGMGTYTVGQLGGNHVKA